MAIPLISVEILEEVVSVIGALALGKGVGPGLLRFAKLISPPPKKGSGPPEDLKSRLAKANAEMEAVIGELRATAEERTKAIEAAESSLAELNARERELKEKVEGTEGISQATVDALAKRVEERLERQIQNAERPKKHRDYALFALGVVVSGIVGIGVEATKPVWEKALHLQSEPAALRENGSGTAPQPVQTPVNHPVQLPRN